ncbi:unnamed protein product [Dibothriocephalus latus]|uniref:Coiled-coil domain-containing protein 6 n=1 Tax=Dibothriocephalus latus TaxID=60516 RepID=A0A3P7N6N6_DIBLA|nr:unnamed protein product [Dibothriocephalus latus]
MMVSVYIRLLMVVCLPPKVSEVATLLRLKLDTDKHPHPRILLKLAGTCTVLPTLMADSASEVDLESDTSSVDGLSARDQLQAKCDQMQRRMDLLQQENRVLKTEVETLKLKVRSLMEVNQQLRRNSVSIQAKAEQEEEYISNMLQRRISELKKEKEALALNYEQEEECLTNELNKKLVQLQREKELLERTLAQEQEAQVTSLALALCRVNKLKHRIEKLENEKNAKQQSLDKLRHEKIELENALEQEQEALVNRLWKKMDKLEAEKRRLQDSRADLEVDFHRSGTTRLCSGVVRESKYVFSPDRRSMPSHSLLPSEKPLDRGIR